MTAKPSELSAPSEAARPFTQRPKRSDDEREPRAPKHQPPWQNPKPKVSRGTPADQTRLFLSVGAEMGVGTGDIVGAILGETGLPGQVVGTVDIRERHLFVDVAAEHANAILAKLNRTRIKGNKVKAKLA